MSKNVVFDLDGVIHSYTSGYIDTETLPDPPVDGIREAIKDIRDAGYKVFVVSTRSRNKKGRNAIRNYLDKWDIVVDDIRDTKPPAFVYIDDRAICFDGDSESLLNKIDNFKTWQQIKEVENEGH